MSQIHPGEETNLGHVKPGCNCKNYGPSLGGRGLGITKELVDSILLERLLVLLLMVVVVVELHLLQLCHFHDGQFGILGDAEMLTVDEVGESFGGSHAVLEEELYFLFGYYKVFNCLCGLLLIIFSVNFLRKLINWIELNYYYT